MLFTPLRKAIIAGAGVVAVGAAAGVGVHAATTSPTALTASTATPAASPSPGDGGKVCKPAHPAALGAARQVLAIAASTLGQTQQQILDQLRSGKTLDQIAGSQAATIEQQALDKLKTGLDKRVSAGKLSSTQETDMLTKAKAALDKAMSSDLSGKLPPAGAAAGCPAGGVLGMLVQVTAQKTGLSVQQVMADLQAGQSIDQIAGSKAADIKSTVLQMLQQKESSALDKLMGRAGLKGAGGPGLGHGRFGGPNRPKPSATPTPSA
ncbi:MAG TPA: hypothetical protein VFC09_08815 [Candidatus Dormibacteraeota bacterium]|nr:hypothetical protein [Candidatus Dormibacteraeota bacterium]